jgi:hypothetical protein
MKGSSFVGIQHVQTRPKVESIEGFLNQARIAFTALRIRVGIRQSTAFRGVGVTAATGAATGRCRHCEMSNREIEEDEEEEEEGDEQIECRLV